MPGRAFISAFLKRRFAFKRIFSLPAVSAFFRALPALPCPYPFARGPFPMRFLLRALSRDPLPARGRLLFRALFSHACPRAAGPHAVAAGPRETLCVLYSVL